MSNALLLALAVAAAMVVGLLLSSLVRRVHPILIIIAVSAFVSEADLTRLLGGSLNYVVEIGMLGMTMLIAVPGAIWLSFRWRLVMTPAFGCLLLLPIAGLITAPWSVMPFRSLIGGVSVTAMLILVYYAADRFGSVQVAAAILFGLIALMIGSIAWDVVGPGPPPDDVTGLRPSGFGGVVRWQGLTDQQNQLGRTAAMCIVLCMVHLRRWPTSWVAIGVALGSLALLGSQSKTSLAAALAAAAILAWRRDRLELMAAAGAIPGAALLIAILLGANPLVKASAEVDSDALFTATGRTTAWITALDLSSARPLFGHGSFASLGVLQGEMRVGRVGYDIVDPHNTILTLLLTQGLVGVCLLIGAVVLFLRSPLRNTAEARDMTVVLAALGIISLAENILWKANTSVMLLALCLATLVTRRPTKRNELMLAYD